VDAKAKRIALSIKQLTAFAPRPEKPAARQEKPAPQQAKPTPKLQPSMNEKLAALSVKWKVR